MSSSIIDDMIIIIMNTAQMLLDVSAGKLETRAAVIVFVRLDWLLRKFP